MRKRLKQAVAALLCLTGCTPAPRPAGEVKSWAVYYNTELRASDFKHYDLVVFDRRHHPDFKSLKGKTKVLAYISIGEVYDDVPEKVKLDKVGAIIHQNDRWRSHVVDVTAPLWRELVLEYVDNAAQKGFDGVMLDTIDSPLHWAQTQAPARVSAMREAAADLILAIRRAHPGMKIMLNRGFELLPLVGRDIDYLLAESILTHTDVSSGQFELFSPMTYEQVAAQLHRAVALAPQLQVFTLDYWNMDDVKGLERIYARQRAEGFTPYVTTPSLTDHTPEPRSRIKPKQ